MEYKLRGWVEKELDRILELENINKIARLFERFPLNSIEDFCFGLIVGNINYGSQAQALFYSKREMSPIEWEEVMKIIERRSIEIKGKIKLALGR